MSNLVKMLMSRNMFEPEYASILLQHDISTITDKESKTGLVTNLQFNRYRLPPLKRHEVTTFDEYVVNLEDYHVMSYAHKVNTFIFLNSFNLKR